MNSDAIKKTMLANAEQLVRLQSQIHRAFRSRDESSDKRIEWQNACAEFHARYSSLAFPGGYDDTTLDRISSGDSETVENALCFLECRPYFFRSGYMFKDLLRKVKRAQMSPKQTTRLNAILEKWADYQRTRIRKGR